MLNFKKVYLFNLVETIQIVIYSLCSRIIHAIPRNLKNTYEFTNILLGKGIRLNKEGYGFYSFPYSIGNTIFHFFMKIDSSDSRVFEQIILNKEYEPVVNEIRNKKIKIDFILDLGANIGLSSIYLYAHLTPSKIIAIEPSNKTYRRLLKNMEANNLSNVKCIPKGVWSKPTFLNPDISFRDGEDWSFRLIEGDEKGEEGIEVTTINQICEEENITTLDLAKMDIEGGEIEIFLNGNLDWLTKTKVIALEIHDEFNCREKIEEILLDRNFELTHSGELTIGFNKNLI